MPSQHILVPIDFSESSSQALTYAIELAAVLKARLTLLHVIQPIVTGGYDMGIGLPASYIAELEADITQSLATELQRVTDAGLTGDMLIIHGTPFYLILETAKTHQADMIIMGTQGRTGLSHILLGSVAERVVRQAPCPVLVVRPTPAPEPAGDGAVA